MLRALTPIALGLLAFWVRSLSFPSVLAVGRVHLPSNDGYYHLRRIVHALANAPESLGFDRFLNFPHGARAIWPPFFDSAIAWALAPFMGSGDAVDAVQVERIVVWLPPLLGSAAVVVTYAWMRRHFGFGVAVGTAGLLCVLSASSWYARIGMLDHHVAVALVFAVLLGAALSLVRAHVDGEARWWRSALVGGLFALLLHIWPGGLLHVVLIEACLIGFWLTRTDEANAIGFAQALATVQGVACALLLLAGWPSPGHWGEYASTVLSRFQPLFFGCGAAVSLACALFWRHTTLGRSPGSRGAEAVGLAVVVAAALSFGLPGLNDAITNAFAWFGRAERFQGSVLESRPLLFASGEFSTQLLVLRLSYFAVVFPVAWGWLVVREWRGARRPEFWMLSGIALGLMLATLLQTRFFNSFAIPFAAFFALSFQAAWRGLSARVARTSAAAILAAAAVALWFPVADAYRPAAENQLRLLRGAERTYTVEDRYWQALYATAVWLRDHTPSPADAYDPDARPAFGVLGHWQYGHLLQFVAERPMMVGNFGDDVPGNNYARSFRYFQLTEARAVEMLDALRIRYVVIRPLDIAGGDHGAGSMIRRLADPNGGALSRHRLLYEQRVLRGIEEGPRSHFRVYERVAGAVIVGSAPPGSVVEARLAYTSPTGRSGEFRRTAQVQEDGTYRMRLAYATVDAPAGFDLDAVWQVGVVGRGQSVPVPIRESQLQRGDQIEVPAL